jgi:hypothetical protein
MGFGLRFCPPANHCEKTRPPVQPRKAVSFLFATAGRSLFAKFRTSDDRLKTAFDSTEKELNISLQEFVDSRFPLSMKIRCTVVDLTAA